METIHYPPKKETIILNSIEDADHCVERKIHENRYILTTLVSVNIYLREMHNLESQSMSQFFDDAEMSVYEEMSFRKLEKLLAELDAIIGASLNKQMGLKMRYFQPLYGYVGQRHMVAIYSFIEGLKRFLDLYESERILLYNDRFNIYLDGISDMASLAALFFPELEFRIIERKNVTEKRELGVFLGISSFLRRFVDRLWYYRFNKLIESLVVNMRFRSFSSKARTILVHEPLYDMSFLRRRLKGFNVLYYPSGSSENPIGFKKYKIKTEFSGNLQNIDYVWNKGDLFTQVFLKDVRADFTKNIQGYLACIDRLKNYIHKWPVCLGIWGVAPIWKTRAMIFEFLSSRGVTVLGAQHGCKYGEVRYRGTFYSDFNRCDYFLSYGFTEGNLSRIYPDEEKRCTILPVGANTPDFSCAKNEIDVLFPIQNTMSIAQGGMTRMSPDKLAERQIKLLEYLNSLTNRRVVVKPFANSDYNNCGPLIHLGRLTNLELVNDLKLNRALKIYSPKLVIIEYPSQPLFDCLHLNCEVFLMNDGLHTYSEEAFDALSKRVHFSKDTDRLIKKIDMFLKGQLESKKDKEFYNHYVYKNERIENILGNIEKLAQRAI